MLRKMKNLLILLIYVNMLTLEMTKTDSIHALEQYILTCGFDFLCNKSIINSSVYPHYSMYRDIHLCPDCWCDNACLQRGDCCPDIPLFMPKMECFPTTFFPPNSKLDSYKMVTTCPENTKESLKNACERNYTVIERLNVAPVTSNSEAYFIGFKNEFCAKCNGFNDFQMWSLDIDCELFADFNYLSTYEEILTTSEDSNCTIAHSPGNMPVRKCTENHAIINACPQTYATDSNITKNASDYIKWACSYFEHGYKFFKNVFCFICNKIPRLRNKEIISGCNSTGIWQPYDSGLESACKFYPLISSTYPFKNIFCYMCNRDWFDQRSRYLDSLAGIVENGLIDQNRQQFVYLFNLEGLKITNQQFESLKHAIGNWTHKNSSTIDECKSHSFENHLTQRNKLVNTSNLIMKYYSILGYTGTEMCGKYNLPMDFEDYRLSRCSCEPTCFFDSFIECCVDLAILFPVTCLSDQYLTIDDTRRHNETHYLVVNGCLKQKENGNVCENSKDLLCAIPLYDSNSGIVYRNFYCDACGEYINPDMDMRTINSILRNNLKPWDVQLTCAKFIDTAHYLYVKDIIQLAKEQSCNIKLLPKPNETVKCNNNEHNLIQECNKTGLWEYFDEDIQWACENQNHPSMPVSRSFTTNLFCDICNPTQTHGTFIASCNTTGAWSYYDPEVEKACDLFPELKSTFPYKNVFCRLCNVHSYQESESNYIDGDMRYAGGEINWKGSDGMSAPSLSTFRNIFSLSSYPEEDMTTEQNSACSHREIVDPVASTCRNVSCYPGKRLINNTCKPLLSVTSNMIYTMSFGLEGNVNAGFTNTVPVLEDIEMNIKHLLYNELKTYKLDFKYFILVSNLTCLSRDDMRNISESVRIDVRTTFYEYEYINRFEIEENLLNLIKNRTEVEALSNTYNYTLFIRENADRNMDILTMTERTNYKRKCRIVRNSGHEFVPFRNYRLSYISKILLCRQILLNENEYIFDEHNMKLQVLATGVVYNFNEFEISAEGKARICIEDYLTGHNKRQAIPNTMETALGYATLICVAISLICLLITFIIYCLFPKLRSLPGKNNMCLVFSLFCAQALLQFGLRQTNEQTICRIIGIFLHFFWLSTFGCMNICCFHMFRALGGSLAHQMGKHGDNKVLFQYMCYSFGLSLFIIIINIVVTLGMTSGQSIGYGGQMCFLSHVISAGVTFLVPLTFVCISNTVFFSLTMNRIRHTPKIQSNKENRNDVILYIKLFTITGITWILMIVDAFLPLSPFSFIVTILNGFQGAYIFVSYVCNKRVLRLLTNLVTGEEISTTNSSSGFRSRSTALTRSTTETRT